MKKIWLTTCLSIVFTQTLVAQHDKQLLYQSWILTRLETEDSSRVVTKTINDSTYIRYVFRKGDRLERTLNPVMPMTSNSFTFKGNELSIFTSVNNPLKFTVAKLSKDSLVLLDVTGHSLALEGRRLYFVREGKIVSNYLASVHSNTTLIANRNISPHFHGELFKESDVVKIHPHNSGSISGFLVFAGDSLRVEVKKADNVGNLYVKKAIKFFKGTYRQWEVPAEAKHLVIQLPFTLVYTAGYHHGRNGLNERTGGANYRVSFIPFRENIDKAEQRAVDPDNEAPKLLEAGVRFFETNDFENAIKKLSACINTDPYMLDAYLFRAYSHYKLNKITEACVDLNYLASLDQKVAKKLAKEYCQ